jgi:pimeloyl-ACP methyl ester carboxylesterase
VTSTGQLGIGSAQRVTLRLSSGPIAALETGADGDPAVLLVPGFTGSKEDFGPILDSLAAAGYHATAIDLPGQFESPGPADPAAYAPDLLAAIVLEIAAGLGGSTHLVGHSFGGLVARAAVIAEPAAFADLVLMDSGPAALTGDRRARIELLAPVFESVGLAGLFAAMRAVEAADPGYVAPPAELAEFLERRFLASTPDMLLGMANGLRGEPDRVAELVGTGIRSLVLHGARDDAWLPAVQAEMAERLGSDYVVIENAAHSPAVEDPVATVEALLHFWRKPR